MDFENFNSMYGQNEDLWWLTNLLGFYSVQHLKQYMYSETIQRPFRQFVRDCIPFDATGLWVPSIDDVMREIYSGRARCGCTTCRQDSLHCWAMFIVRVYDTLMSSGQGQGSVVDVYAEFATFTRHTYELLKCLGTGFIPTFQWMRARLSWRSGMQDDGTDVDEIT